MAYQVIIVGAGTGGCVMATRLSEDPQRSVLLLEAGPDYPTEEDLPAEIRNGLVGASTHDWGYLSQADTQARSVELLRGKLVGGCSATNLTGAVRGTPSDYDEWAERGNPGWSFSEVLPYFCQVENDVDFDDSWHGKDGYVPIRRDAPETFLPEHDAFLKACSALGYARVADHNAPDALGAGIWPKNLVTGVRQSAALTYLAAARGRPNLTVRSDVHVNRVVFEGKRAVGVRLAGSNEVIRSDTVILSAGTYGSPAIMLRSGLGPADHLKSLGINIVQELPGVGQNLIDHPMVMLRFTASASKATKDSPAPQALLTLKSPQASASYDLHIAPLTIYPTETGTSPTFMMFAALMKPSSRGQLQLSSSDPNDAPVIDMGYFTNPDDMPSMLYAVRVAEQIAGMSAFSDIILQQVFPHPQTSDDRNELEAAIRANVTTYHHPVGTCHMGPASDPNAVVDSKGWVHGVEGLMVVDASIMPTIPAANTNLPTFMLAERCSAWLNEEL